MGHSRAIPRFLLVGAVGFAVDLGATSLLALVLPVTPARLIALLIAISATWWLNRRLTFASRVGAPLPEWARYLAGSAGGATLNAAASLGVLWIFPAAPLVLALAIGSAIGIVANYTSAVYFAFRRETTPSPGETTPGQALTP